MNQNRISQETTHDRKSTGSNVGSSKLMMNSFEQQQELQDEEIKAHHQSIQQEPNDRGGQTKKNSKNASLSGSDKMEGASGGTGDMMKIQKINFPSDLLAEEFLDLKGNQQAKSKSMFPDLKRSNLNNSTLGDNLVSMVDSQIEQLSFDVSGTEIDSDEIKLNKCMWRSNDPFRTKWDLFVMLIAIWNCIALPVDVSFEPEIMQQTSFTVVNWMIDTCFAIDIFVNFRTTYFDAKTGDEVSDLRRIRKNYLNGRFWIDFVATIPVDQIAGVIAPNANTATLQLFGLLKLIRVLRLGRIIAYLNVRQDIKASMKLIKLFFFLIMYFHVLGCAWWYIVKVNEDWMPILDTVNVKTDLYNQTVWRKYWISLYYAVHTFVANELGPVDTLQIMFVSVFLIIGAFVNANLFGELAVLIAILNQKSSEFQSKLDSANTAMKNMKLPVQLQSTVIHYLMQTASTLDAQNELNEFLKMLSPSLKADMFRHLFSRVLGMLQTINTVDQSEQLVVKKIQIRLTQPEEQVIAQGEEGQHLYFLSRGECEVKYLDQNNKESQFKLIKAGQMFGEIAVLFGCKRTATVFSLTYSTMASLHKDDYEEITMKYPDMPTEFKEHAKQYEDDYFEFKKKLLMKIEYFNGLTDDDLDELMYKMELEHFSNGDQVIKQGCKINKLYFVQKGSLDMILKMGITDQTVDRLAQGCIIGTYSSLMGYKQKFAAKASSNTVLLTLSMESIEVSRQSIRLLDKQMSDIFDRLENGQQPSIDYTIYYSLRKKKNPKIKFQGAVNRIVLLSRFEKRQSNSIMNAVKNAGKDVALYDLGAIYAQEFDKIFKKVTAGKVQQLYNVLSQQDQILKKLEAQDEQNTKEDNDKNNEIYLSDHTRVQSIAQSESRVPSVKQSYSEMQKKEILEKEISEVKQTTTSSQKLKELILEKEHVQKEEWVYSDLEKDMKDLGISAGMTSAPDVTKESVLKDEDLEALFDSN